MCGLLVAILVLTILLVYDYEHVTVVPTASSTAVPMDYHFVIVSLRKLADRVKRQGTCKDISETIAYINSTLPHDYKNIAWTKTNDIHNGGMRGMELRRQRKILSELLELIAEEIILAKSEGRYTADHHQKMLEMVIRLGNIC